MSAVRTTLSKRIVALNAVTSSVTSAVRISTSVIDRGFFK